MATIQQLDALYTSHIQTIRKRFEEALAKTGFDGVLVYSGALHDLFRDDHPYPFKVNASFKLWAPLTDVADCFIYFEPGRQPRLLFNQPTDFWYKSASLPQAYWTRHFDIVPIENRAAARAHLPANLRNVAVIGEHFPEISAWELGEINPAALFNYLDYFRAYKTPYELECMREASRLGARGHIAAAAAFRDGATEFEIHLAFLRACGLREQELPYNAIIALNESAAVLHYQVLERQRPNPTHSLLIDAGAEFAGYASDITRTYSLTDPDFRALIDKFDELQQALCSNVRAGIDWREVHLSAHYRIAALLQEADIIRCSPEEAVKTGLSSVFFPHGLGHLLGLQVHDAGGFMRSPEGGEIPRPEGHPFLRLTRVLEEHFVVTMEPGIYFIDQLLDAARADARGKNINWSRVESFRKFGGIRIEDDLAITASGCENLTRDAFKTVAASA